VSLQIGGIGGFATPVSLQNVEMLSFFLKYKCSSIISSLHEATIALDRAARRIGLEINQARTKYIICGTKKKYV
jgi:hypothetical protein